MQFKLFFLIAWSYFLITQGLGAQTAPSKQCLVHLDKSFYASGEVIWFKIYLPVESVGHTFNIKVGIMDKNGAYVDGFFLSTQGKSHASGYYKIPFNAAAGMYQLAFMGIEQTKKEVQVLATVAVPIYNDLEKTNPTETNLIEPKNGSNLALSDLKVEITVDKEVYKSRDLVQASATIKDHNGIPVKANLSVAVTDWALAGEGVLSKSNLQTGLPLHGATLSNQVYTQIKLKSELNTQNLVSIFSPQDWQMMYTSPKQTVLFVEIPPFYGSKNIQFLGHPNPDIQVELLNPFPVASTEALVYPAGIQRYLELSRQRKKIYQLYTGLESQLKPLPLGDTPTPLLPDRSLQLSQFEVFEDLAVFFREISTPLSFKQDRKTGLYTGKMYNPGTLTDYPSSPMFIIDGKVTRDADFVARLKMNQIEKIDLYYQPDKLFANFKAIGRSGVVNIRSKSGLSIPEAEAEDVFTISGLQVSTGFPLLSAEQLKSNQPFFRPQVFWAPSLETDANGRANFSFLQSDDWSRFRIQVVVQAEDGRMGLGIKEYEVNWK